MNNLSQRKKILYSQIILWSIFLISLIIFSSIVYVPTKISVSSYGDLTEINLGKIMLYSKEGVMFYYRNKKQVERKINKNPFLVENITNNSYLFVKDNIPFCLEIAPEENSFSFYSYFYGSSAFFVPFVFSNVYWRDSIEKQREFDLKDSLILKNKTFKGLLDFYKNLNVTDNKYLNIDSAEFNETEIIFLRKNVLEIKIIHTEGSMIEVHLDNFKSN